MKQNAHIRLEYDHRPGMFDHSDWSALLQGEPEAIAERVRQDVLSALKNGAAKITIVPVRPHEVWDVDDKKVGE